MMEQKPNQSFDNSLAQAGQPEGFDGGQVEPINDPTRSLRLGLAKQYDKYLCQVGRQLNEGLIDENKAIELRFQIDKLSLADFGYEISKGLPVELAKEILGSKMCFGPKEVEKAGIEVREDVPPIPFSFDELEQARELGQMLIYRTSLTLKELNDTISPNLEADGKGKLLSNIDWYKDEYFYTIEKIQPGWALVSKKLTPGSTNINYLQQSVFLANYLVNKVFKGKPLPREYREAIDQLNVKKGTIRKLIATGRLGDLETAAELLIGLRINLLFRQSPAEAIYDSSVHLQNTGERLHMNDLIWASTHKSFGGSLVCVGDNTVWGVRLPKTKIDFLHSDLGASICRRGSDLQS